MSDDSREHHDVRAQSLITRIVPPVVGRTSGLVKPASVAYMALFGLFWAAYLAVSVFLPRGYSVFEVLWGRYALHVILTILIVGPIRGGSLIASRRPVLQLARGLLMVATSIAAALAANGMSIDDVRTYLWLAPFIVVALDRFFRDTPSPPSVWIACTISWIGVVLILHPHIPAGYRAPFWAIVATVTFAGYELVTPSLRSDAATTSVFYSGLAVLIVMSAIVPWVWKPLTMHAVMVYLGMGIAGWLSLLFLDKALHEMEAGTVVVFGYLHLVAGVFLNSAVAGSGLDLPAILGCIMILTGCAMALL